MKFIRSLRNSVEFMGSREVAQSRALTSSSRRSNSSVKSPFSSSALYFLIKLLVLSCLYGNGADKMVFPHFYTLGLYLPVATLIVMNMTCIFINHKAVSSYLFHIISFSSLVHFSLGLQKAPNNIYQKVQNRFTLI